MSRRISLLLVLGFFLLSIVSVPVFAAKAKNDSNTAGSGKWAERLSRRLSVDGASDGSFTLGKPINASQQQLGFNPNGTRIVGYTYYDQQHNGSMGRQIAVGGGWVHNAWMIASTASGTNADRTVSYFAYKLGGAVGDTARITNLDNEYGWGYCTLAFDPSGDFGAIVGYHLSSVGTKYTVDFAAGAGSFGTPVVFPSANCQGIVVGQDTPEGKYIWPVICSDVDAGGNGILHAVSTESTPDGSTDLQSIVYYRSSADYDTVGVVCGIWMDSVENIMPIVTADPNSPKVAVVYFQPADYAFTSGTQQHNNDLVYRENTNYGIGTIAAWPITHVTNYDGGDLERAYTDVDAIYTADGCLHIAWNAVVFDSAATSPVANADKCKLRHWDDCNECLSLVSDANYTDDAFARPAWNPHISKMTMSECTVGANKLLYMVYTKRPSSNAAPDGSLDEVANGELFAQASSTGGETWGPPVNLTNTVTNNCAPGACRSEDWASSAMYVTDSLRIQYIEDLDAGIAIQTEGTWTNNPVKNLSVGCFAMASYVDIGATPSELKYPYHTTPNQIKNETIVLANAGNSTGSWSVASTAAFITFPGATSGVCNAGCSNTASFVARVTGPASEGFYQGNINVTVTSPDKSQDAVVAIPVDLYNFVIFYLPKDVAIRTQLVRMNVNQASEIANSKKLASFSYFSDSSDYIADGFLILGNSANNLTYSTFGGGGGTGAPTASNPYGYLYAATDSVIYDADSTGLTGVRHASGKGYNRDSTLQFTCDYFAPKHPDSANFMILRYYIYKGPKNPNDSVKGLTVGYYADIDIPSDTGVNNLGGFDTTLTPNATRRNIMYQRGTMASGPNGNANRFLGVGGRTHEGFPAIGGFVVPNPAYIHPQAGWENDSLWKYLQAVSPLAGISGGDYDIFPPHTDPGGSTGDDLSSNLLLLRNATVRGDTTGTGPDTLKVAIIIGGSSKTGSFAQLTQTFDRAYKFIRTNKLIFCRCGDADGNKSLNVSDAVRLIGFIFSGAAAPNPLCRGDADGNGAINVSDAVKLIGYIFSGATAPAGC
jgi:hypothetical protein